MKLNVDIEEAAAAKEKEWIEFCGYTLRNGDVKSIFISGAEFALSHLWVSVKDRLPKEREYVFTTGGTRVYNILLHHDGKFYSSLNQRTYDGGVTHWMPIPELNIKPKDE
ncbi:DUF551 domain-containing protein [Bacteroides fragilis]|jgi:hypothetical protein|uniref:DUF551 domain-containing protein n=1 Tax=Bacteroides fragilis TaxID=817 RepID=UPI00202F5388|nr:DUF551 domain-containing protein [Bacteroides fragilis]MCM0217501.1 DUF551 domain-containing protein [Bacteroides fragilis]MCM0265998.1 DUF551 domain-containing protein [Bacteroides fragilis]